MTTLRYSMWVCSLFLVTILTPTVNAADRPLMIVSTTSVEHSGLMADLLPRFRDATGVRAVVAAFGTGQALRMARNGDADVLIVHDEGAEEAFVAEGYGVERRTFMVNEYLVVGPVADPAGVSGLRDATEAFRKIRAARALFVSRGDNSGTHHAELRVWGRADFNVGEFGGGWYREVGSGMGPTLNTAAAMAAYTLTDQGTWLAFRNRSALAVMVEGDPDLINPYSVLLINPDRHPHLQHAKARKLAGWLMSDQAQAAISNFRIDGQQLFRPVVHKNNGN